jgi:hypothetical protein
MQEYLILTLFGLILFFRTLRYGLAVDDNISFMSNRKLGTKKRTVLDRIKVATYGAGIFENNEYDHLLTTALSISVACMIYSCFGNIWAALLWLAHPLNNQVTIWMNGRRYQISILLGLLAYKLPYLGFIFFPAALWIHPISAILLVSSLLFSGLIALTWLIPCLLLKTRYTDWINQRWSIQDFKEYKEFNIGKLSLAARCYGEYWLHFLFPRGFTMYHPDIWGIAELQEQKKANYAFNGSYFAYIALLVFILYMGWVAGRSCLLWAILANCALFQWCGVWKNVTQLWAQRYASLFSIFGTLYLMGLVDAFVPTHFQLACKMSLLVWYTVITLKDMDMYQNFYSFYLKHIIDSPHNENAAYFSTIALNNNAVHFIKNKDRMNALMNDAYSSACGFYWCMNNQKPDLIHDFMKGKLAMKKQVKEQKVDFEKDGL